MHNNSSDGSQKADINEQVKQILASWGGSTELKNYFRNGLDCSYKSREMNMMIDQYERIDHPLSIEIINLLRATIHFRRATASDFKEIRDANTNDPWILDLFNEIGLAITSAQIIQKQQPTHSDEYIILTDAIDYCLTSINNRLDELKSMNDYIYRFFLSKPNHLKRFIP